MLTRQRYVNEATGSVEQWSATRRLDGSFDVLRGVWEAAPATYWEPPSSVDLLTATAARDEQGTIVVQIDAPDGFTAAQMARGRVAVKREIRALRRAEQIEHAPELGEDGCA